MSCCGVNPEDGSILLPPWLLWLAGGYSGTEQGGISKEPMARVSCVGTGHGHQLQVPGPADSAINIYIHSRSGAVQLPGSRWKISQAQGECKQAAGLGCR